jgi:3-oxoacyl-[acyl-carrier-protein] synthase-1
MANEQVVIVGVGMMTAVGLTAPETAASVRSGTARFAETSIRDKSWQPFTLAVVPEEGLPGLSDRLVAAVGLTARETRLLRLATMPLRECVRPVASQPPSMGLCLALPEAPRGTPAVDGARFLAMLALQVGGVFDPQRSDATHTGRAGGLTAVGQAAAVIEQGLADFMIAGGVDTYFDLLVLATLDRDGRIKSETNADGFIPGEGAGFVLLASRRAAAARSLPTVARISSVAVGFEVGHLDSAEPYKGDGLAATISQLAGRGAVDEPIGEVYSSINGENHWAKEWGVSYLRNRPIFRPDHRVHHPADCYGDNGAASGPLMLGLAALAGRDSRRRAPVLVYGSSDQGVRAAVIVISETH